MHKQDFTKLYKFTATQDEKGKSFIGYDDTSLTHLYFMNFMHSFWHCQVHCFTTIFQSIQRC